MTLRRVVVLATPVVLFSRWRRGLRTIVADHAAYWRRRSRRPGEFVLAALGDSLAQGLTAARPELGFVGLLADHLEDELCSSVAVHNLAVSGATVSDVLADQLPRLDGSSPDLVVVCVGTNDVTRSDPERFREDWHTLCEELAGRADRTRILVADVPDFRGGPHQVTAQRFAALAREVLAEYPALVPVPLHAITRRQRLRELGRDLTHPGNAGHRRYLAAFLTAVERA